MTPKEKADKLCMRFLIETTTDIPYGVNKIIAKECALIAVDEILKLNTELTYDYENIEKTQYTIQTFDSYWSEVKKEIENL